ATPMSWGRTMGSTAGRSYGRRARGEARRSRAFVATASSWCPMSNSRWLVSKQISGREAETLSRGGERSGRVQRRARREVLRLHHPASPSVSSPARCGGEIVARPLPELPWARLLAEGLRRRAAIADAAAPARAEAVVMAPALRKTVGARGAARGAPTIHH